MASKRTTDKKRLKLSDSTGKNSEKKEKGEKKCRRQERWTEKAEKQTKKIIQPLDTGSQHYKQNSGATQ